MTNKFSLDGLNEQIATEVMGWVKEGDKWRTDKIGAGTLIRELPKFSSCKDAAWELIQHLQKDGEAPFSVILKDPSEVRLSPLEISLIAMKTVEYKT